MSRFFPWLAAELQALEQQGLRRFRQTVNPLPGGRCQVGGQTLLNFATNDYLDLAGHPALVEAARAAVQLSGSGARASALVSGRTEWHQLLEEQLCRFEQQAACLLFPSGYVANIGTITALTTAEDVIFCERQNHASLVDGCRLSPAAMRVYRSEELEGLEKELRKASSARQRLIVTDSYFSMDGTLAPLPELCDLAGKHAAVILIDEAHATGVLGATGRGAAEHFGVEQRIAVRVGTLSKALGSLGGFVTGSQELIDWIYNRARPQIYSTALPPSACAAARAALQILAREPERGPQLLARCRTFRDRLRELELPLIPGFDGPIVPLVLHDPERAVAAARQLRERGFLVPAIRPPTVPQGTSRLRISLTLGHSPEDLNALAAALREVAGPA